MSETPSFYRVRVQGHLAPRWLGGFEDMEVTHLPDGGTVLVGPVQDQAALYGLLGRLRDLGVPLLSVQKLRQPPDQKP